MVTIQVANLMSRVVGVYDWNIHKLLDRQLSYQVEGVEFIPSVQNGFWDGIVHLYSTKTFTFSTGLLSKVCDILAKNNIQYTINDTRIKPICGLSLPTNTNLRQDQEDVVKICMDKARGICMLPTGYGKSFLMVDLICRLNLPTVIIVHSLSIADQFVNDFKQRANIKIGYVGNGIVDIKPITVCMIQTLANAFKIKSKEFKSENINIADTQKIYNMCTDAQAVITDEMHAMLTGTNWSKIFNKFTNSYYRLGFSATPFKTKSISEQLVAESIYGPKIAEATYQECIDKGYIVKPDVIIYKYKQQGLPYGMKFQQAYKERIVENEDRNYNICKIAFEYFKQNKKVFITVTQLSHGKLLKKMLEEVIGKGNVIFAEGCVSTEKRQNGIRDFENGGKILIASKVFDCGLNINSMDVIINTRSNLSQTQVIQTMGRALRNSPGKNKAYIIDIYDTNVKYFAYHSRERLAIYEACGFNIEFREC